MIDATVKGILERAAALPQGEEMGRYFPQKAVREVVEQLLGQCQRALREEVGEVMWGEGFPNQQSAQRVPLDAAKGREL